MPLLYSSVAQASRLQASKVPSGTATRIQLAIISVKGIWGNLSFQNIPIIAFLECFWASEVRVVVMLFSYPFRYSGIGRGVVGPGTPLTPNRTRRDRVFYVEILHDPSDLFNASRLTSSQANTAEPRVQPKVERLCHVSQRPGSDSRPCTSHVPIQACVRVVSH